MGVLQTVQQMDGRTHLPHTLLLAYREDVRKYSAVVTGDSLSHDFCLCPIAFVGSWLAVTGPF